MITNPFELSPLLAHVSLTTSELPHSTQFQSPLAANQHIHITVVLGLRCNLLHTQYQKLSSASKPVCCVLRTVLHAENDSQACQSPVSCQIQTPPNLRCRQQDALLWAARGHFVHSSLVLDLSHRWCAAAANCCLIMFQLVWIDGPSERDDRFALFIP